MATDHHYVIIGNGVAGIRAATVLRERDPDNRITVISIGGLLFYDRYQLPQVFEGKRDWRISWSIRRNSTRRGGSRCAASAG